MSSHIFRRSKLRLYEILHFFEQDLSAGVPTSFTIQTDSDHGGPWFLGNADSECMRSYNSQIEKHVDFDKTR